jgi:hypothetical protein
MTAGNRDLADLFSRLRRSWSIETGHHWKIDNPAAGQCGVTALVVNDTVGGSILKTDVNGAWHFYNVVDGRRVDFTMSQFSSPIFYDDLPSDRAEALLDCSPEQYDLLSSRMKSAASRALKS